MVTSTLHVFSCYWSGEAPFDTKLGTQEDEVKWNTSAKIVLQDCSDKKGHVSGINVPLIGCLCYCLIERSLKLETACGISITVSYSLPEDMLRLTKETKVMLN